MKNGDAEQVAKLQLLGRELCLQTQSGEVHRDGI